MKKYEDIIGLSRPVSKKHPPMSRENRAAQFAPFAALTGFEGAIKETARVTGEKIELDEIKRIYEEYYADHSFTFITDKNPDLKQVVNTNKCLIYLLKQEDKLLIVSMIDNLLKGASGQAVHNMNLLFGLEETVGLHLKPSAF